MTIEELRKTIEQRAGVPADLLTGETEEENISQARAILEYKRDYEKQLPRSTGEQFASWMRAQLEDNEKRTAEVLGMKYTRKPEDPELAALEDIAETVRVENGGYPIVRDGGLYPNRLKVERPAREAFAEYFGQYE